MQHNYSNPRIDFAGQCGDALRGKVKLDTLKFIWLSSMFMLGSVGSILTASWSAILLFIGFTGITLCLGHSLGMHRRFIHRSYQCPKALEVLFVHFGTLVGLAGPHGMLRTHDLRDWAQRQTNCHPYFSHAEPWYKDAYWQLFCSIELESPPIFRPERAIAEDKIYYWMEKTWILQQLPWAVLFYSLGGWAWVCWGIASRVTVSVLGHWVIGYFAHNHGHKSWRVTGAAVQGHNIPWMSLLTMGENWHNNHHAFPYSAKLGLQAGEWDPGWWILLALRRLGIVSNLVVPQADHGRPELVRL